MITKKKLDFEKLLTNCSPSYLLASSLKYYLVSPISGFWVWSRKTMQSWCICSQSFLILPQKSDFLKSSSEDNSSSSKKQQHSNIVKCVPPVSINSGDPSQQEHMYITACDSRFIEGIIPRTTVTHHPNRTPSSSQTTVSSRGYVVNKAYQFTGNNAMQQPLLKTAPFYPITSLD